MDSPSPNWIQLAIGLVAAFLTGGGIHKALTVYLTRRNRSTEVHESFARSRKLTIEGDAEMYDIVERLHIRIDQMQVKFDSVCVEKNEWQITAGKQEIELELHRAQVKKLKALLDLHEIRYSELDAQH